MAPPSSTSGSSRSRKHPEKEKAHRSSSSTARSSKPTQPSSKKSSRSSVVSPPQSPAPSVRSLHSQRSNASEKLPPLPDSVAPSPASSVAQLHRDSSRSKPPSVADSAETRTRDLHRTAVEDEDTDSDEESSTVETPGPIAPHTDYIQARPSSRPLEEHFETEQVEAPYIAESPRSLHYSPHHQPPSLHRPPIYHLQSQPANFSHYSTPASHSLGSPLQGYHPQVAYYPTHAAGAGYYPPTPTAGHPASFMPHPSANPRHFSGPIPTMAPAAVAMGGPSMPGGPLQRQASIGSRASFSADATLPGSPLFDSSPSVDRAQLAESPSGGAATSGDDPNDLTHRIQSTISNMASISAALPDLHQLLSRYRETHGQLGHREELIRKAEVEQADSLRQKQQHIDALVNQLEVMAREHSNRESTLRLESSKLRMEIGNLGDKLKELGEALTAAEKAKSELQEQKEDLEKDKEELEKDKEELEKEVDELETTAQKEKEELQEAKQALEKEKAELEKTAQMDKEELERKFETWKETREQEFETERESMKEAFEERLQNQEDEFETTKMNMAAKFDKEREALRLDLTKQKEDLEAQLIQKQEELNTIAKERESWKAEREELLKGWQDEKANLLQEWEEKCKNLAQEYTTAQEELQQSVVKLQAELNTANDEKVAAERAKDKLKQRWEEDRAKFEKAIAELTGVADTLGKEKTKLQRMVETFGEVTDIKSKGDTFYVDAFRVLSKQIVDLSEEHFENLPISPSTEVLAKIPAEIPPFMTNTHASRCLRAAWVQHTVSNTLCYRVFQPFLFSLGRRYDKADGLFQTMSAELRNKSTRKEAIWRQHTLYAAYTASTAKKTTNAAAGAVVEEIVDQLRHFADPRQLERIYAAVRRIVKTAAETWRYARLEREMVSARMPPAEDEDEDEEQWTSHDYPDFDPSTLPPPPKGPRRTLLRLLPIIEREPVHESLRADDERRSPDVGCVYSRGVALHSDCAPVLARWQELQSRTTMVKADGGCPPDGGGGSKRSTPRQARTPASSASPRTPRSPTGSALGRGSPRGQEAGEGASGGEEGKGGSRTDSPEVKDKGGEEEEEEQQQQQQEERGDQASKDANGD